MKKGNHPHGTAHVNSLFDKDELFQIRQYAMAGYRTSAIAMRYGVSVTTIQRLLAGKTYKNEHKNAPVSQAEAR
jgi:transposase|tara:strand:+ start:1001 stop:1222 length:222 start_codon:yes stop_codon:yes gene_type:complete